MGNTVELFTSKRKLERKLGCKLDGEIRSHENEAVCISIQLGRISRDIDERPASKYDDSYIKKAEEHNCVAVLKRKYRAYGRKGIEYVGYQLYKHGLHGEITRPNNL